MSGGRRQAQLAGGRPLDGGARRHAAGERAQVSGLPKLVVLRQVVGDREPRGFGADENVCCGLDGRTVDQRAQSDVRKRAFSDY